jgi:hypothetical protein
MMVCPACGSSVRVEPGATGAWQPKEPAGTLANWAIMKGKRKGLLRLFTRGSAAQVPDPEERVVEEFPHEAKAQALADARVLRRRGWANPPRDEITGPCNS